jgi:drug/metabolite transporter (DMT)-like permease
LPTAGRLSALGPVLYGASSFACADLLSKVAFRAGGDPLTVSTLRGVIGVAVLVGWMRIAQLPTFIPRREKTIALGLGIVFAANIFLVFKAIEAIEVAIAILTYFVYPLLTGIAAALIGIEKLTWRGLVAAIVAFLGLGMMLGAHPAGLALAGVLAALAAACCRVVLLLVTRAAMQAADPVVMTLYSMISSTALFVAVSLVALNWQPPVTAGGWLAVIGLSIFVTTGIVGVFASTVRIGPFRTALFMNLEPLLTAIGGIVFLGELMTPAQVVGGGVMIAALTLFQLRR